MFSIHNQVSRFGFVGKSIQLWCSGVATTIVCNMNSLDNIIEVYNHKFPFTLNASLIEHILHPSSILNEGSGFGNIYGTLLVFRMLSNGLSQVFGIELTTSNLGLGFGCEVWYFLDDSGFDPSSIAEVLQNEEKGRHST